jgi:hypothetical protein
MASDYVDAGRRNWSNEPSWGMFSVPETELGLLADVKDADVVEDAPPLLRDAPLRGLITLVLASPSPSCGGSATQFQED